MALNDRILIPLDGSARAEAVLPQVGRLLRRRDAEVLLVRAVDAPLVEGNPYLLDDFMNQARSYVSQLAAKLDAEGARVRSFVQFGAPASVILDAARDEAATVIAMSTHGRSGIARWVLGSVAEKVLRISPVPVLVMKSFETGPAGETADTPPIEKRFAKILLPTDGSPASLECVQAVRELAIQFAAEILLLRITETQQRAPRWTLVTKRMGEADSTNGEPWRNAAVELARAGITVATLEMGGDPAWEILGVAERQGTDLIVMSTHGRSGPSRWVFGSVTEKVLRAARIPMLVVRPAAAAEWRPLIRRTHDARENQRLATGR